MTANSPSSADSNEYSLTIDTQHPSLEGHFPGHPVVPGVVILDNIIQLWQSHNAYQVKQILNAKFMQPLCPGEHYNVQYKLKPKQKIAFILADPISNMLICKGLFSYE